MSIDYREQFIKLYTTLTPIIKSLDQRHQGMPDTDWDPYEVLVKAANVEIETAVQEMQTNPGQGLQRFKALERKMEQVFQVEKAAYSWAGTGQALPGLFAPQQFRDPLSQPEATQTETDPAAAQKLPGSFAQNSQGTGNINGAGFNPGNSGPLPQSPNGSSFLAKSAPSAEELVGWNEDEAWVKGLGDVASTVSGGHPSDRIRKEAPPGKENDTLNQKELHPTERLRLQQQGVIPNRLERLEQARKAARLSMPSGYMPGSVDAGQ